jgi:hypothetical protein
MQNKKQNISGARKSYIPPEKKKTHIIARVK